MTCNTCNNRGFTRISDDHYKSCPCAAGRAWLMLFGKDNRKPVKRRRLEKIRVVAGKSLAEWRAFARRDDCLDNMVPSDLRLLIGAIPEGGES